MCLATWLWQKAPLMLAEVLSHYDMSGEATKAVNKSSKVGPFCQNEEWAIELALEHYHT